MALIVIDASVTAAWLLAEDGFSATPELLNLLACESLVTPPHWPNEMGNAIRKAVRMRRILAEDVPSLVAILTTLDVTVSAASPLSDLGDLVPFALEHGLSVYDAAYIRLAAKRVLPLATLDDAMKRAARKVGVALLPA